MLPSLPCLVLLLCIVATCAGAGAGAGALECGGPPLGDEPGAPRAPADARGRVVSASHDLCAASAQCRRRFYLRLAPEEHDWRLFGFLVDRLLGEMHVDVERVARLLCGANSTAPAPTPAPAPASTPAPTPAPPADDGVYMWLLVLENYSFCTENELPDADAGCVCRRDKVCHETPGDEYAFGRGALTLIVAAFIAVVVYSGGRNALDIAEARARLDALAAAAGGAVGTGSAARKNGTTNAPPSAHPAPRRQARDERAAPADSGAEADRYSTVELDA